MGPLSDSEVESVKEKYSLEEITKTVVEESQLQIKAISKKLYDAQKKRSTILIKRAEFESVVCTAMAQYRYFFGPHQRKDFSVACK